MRDDDGAGVFKWEIVSKVAKDLHFFQRDIVTEDAA